MRDAEAERIRLQRQIDRRLKKMKEGSKLATARKHGIPTSYGTNFRVEFSYAQHQVPIRQLGQNQSVAYWNKPSADEPAVIN